MNEALVTATAGRTDTPLGVPIFVKAQDLMGYSDTNAMLRSQFGDAGGDSIQPSYWSMDWTRLGLKTGTSSPRGRSIFQKRWIARSS